MGKKNRIVDLDSLGSHYTRNKNLFLYNKTSSHKILSGSTLAWIYSLGVGMSQVPRVP